MFTKLKQITLLKKRGHKNALSMISIVLLFKITIAHYLRCTLFSQLETVQIAMKLQLYQLCKISNRYKQ